MLTNKKILLGVSSSVAIYKALELIRLLKKQGADVQVMMTLNATKLISPQLFQAISGHPVQVELFAAHGHDSMPHLISSQQVDLMLLAPATANLIGKLAIGLADDLISTAFLATKAPVLLAPAMNDQMYQHPIVQENIAKLRLIGVTVVEPGLGFLACGSYGWGHLANLETILLYAKKLLTIQDLKGKKVLISAGRTVESIDPVRILTNRSSGKMGLAFAKTAFLRGAKVIVISGAVEIKYPEVPNLEVFFVESTQEMNVAILKYFPKTDMFISAAAVCDYAPVQTLLSKHKKSKNKGMIWNLFLKENPNILGKVLQKKKSGQKIVAFALETDEVFKNAKKKFMSSGIDYLVANEPGVIGQEQGQFIIFEKNHNEIVFLDKFALSSLIFDRLGV